MDTLRTPSWRREEAPRPRPGSEQPAEQPERQPATTSSAPAPEDPREPGNRVSGSGIPLAAAAAMEGVPSVQALRKRIKKGTLQSVRVLHRDAIVVGVELEELARHYPGALMPQEAPPPPSGSPEAQPAPGSEGSDNPAEQPDNPPDAHQQPHPAPQDRGSVAPDAQPDEPLGEQPEPAGSQELQTVDVAIQGWREAREALEVSRREHREELTRTIASYESQLQARDAHGAEATRNHDAREARAVLWGRAAAIGLVAALALGGWLTGETSDRLADERVRAAILTEQTRAIAADKAALEGALERQGAALEAAGEALERAEADASALGAEREALEGQLQELRTEREQARAAARAALRAMGAR
jgi:hypothetical protein